MFVRILLGLLASRVVHAALEQEGAKCGQKRCSTTEYCSPFDTHCRPCSEACDTQSRNYQPQECAKDCQEYLHDQRYILRTEFQEHEDLRGEVQRLRMISTVALTLTCISIILVAYLLAKTLFCWQKISKGIRRTFSKSFVKNNDAKGPVAGKNNKVQDDPELGIPKQNGLRITMPTISASVAPSRSTNTNGSGSLNTASTPLSKRLPSEDTTLDYAYDNPAMTPSPETAQQRTKRESSF